MVEREIAVAEAREVTVEVGGDATVAGWPGESILVVFDDSSADELSVEPSDGVVSLRVPSDARLQVPRRLAVRVSRVGGDLRASGLDAGIQLEQVAGEAHLRAIGGELVLGNVSGDVEIQGVRGRVRCESVGGDLRADGIDGDLAVVSIAGDLHAEHVTGGSELAGRVSGDVVLASLGGLARVSDVAGDLKIVAGHAVLVGQVAGDLRLEGLREDSDIEQVGGDCALANCRGVVSLNRVGGDLRARGVLGGLRAPAVGGDLRLRAFFSPGCEYSVRCGGSASIVVPVRAPRLSASFELESEDGQIEVDLPLQDVERRPGLVRGRLGDGRATVRVQAGGRIHVTMRDHEAGFDSVMDDVLGGMEAGFHEAVGKLFEAGGRARMKDRIGEIDERVERLTEEIKRRAAERLERQAQEMARRAEDMAQRAAERAAEHVTRQAERSWGWRGGQTGWGNWGRRPAQPPQPSPRPHATEEERLTVLRLLADGKITAEQAARLLEALGG